MGTAPRSQPVDHKVSVVIPCYNYARFLTRTVDCLRQQSYENWEAIIVDDGSIDGTETVASGLMAEDPRVRYVHQSNAGTSAAKNTGIRLAQGDLILFLDADDLITPDKLRAHVEHFENNPHIDISYSRFRYFEEMYEDRLFTKLDLSSTKEWSKVINGRYEVALPVFLRGNNMAIHAAVVRKTLVEKVGLFDVEMRALEDWDYWLRCILHGAYIAFLDSPQALALTRVHHASATHNVEFLAYKEAVYERVVLEADRICQEGDERFYNFVKKELRRLERRNRSRLFRRSRAEAQAHILASGLLNFHVLFGVFRRFGFLNCIRIYLGALKQYLFK
ncbi:glycosyltransferase family 2 protein [Pseudomonas resinovorans]|uniref:glycosyltransferase family 2 protein n=1 Tax=Metapseudomonas resinovorans TaxID=53412 RepID=UPI00237F741F|nr:glycosyltransferase family 2 protein [Pseudomonas resinovorans]MDE3737577.1 glycosyltransferase family 2 protein [Pseudomonas resinovorans]